MKNIFLENSCTNCGGGAIPRPFFKKSKLNISLDYWSKVFYSFYLPACLIVCMIFKEKYFPCYALLTDQIALSGCLYFVR